jgi:hypothetical protein
MGPSWFTEVIIPILLISVSIREHKGLISVSKIGSDYWRHTKSETNIIGTVLRGENRCPKGKKPEFSVASLSCEQWKG